MGDGGGEMDQRARRFQNYRWAMAVLAGLVFVLGSFILYAYSIIQTHRDETYRQTFRGLALVGQGMSDTLINMPLILSNFLPLPEVARPDVLKDADKRAEAVRRNQIYQAANKDEFEKAWILRANLTANKLDDLRKTQGFRGLEVTPRWSGKPIMPGPVSACEADREKDLIISEFQQAIKLADCRKPVSYLDSQCSDGGLKPGCSSPAFEAMIPIGSLIDTSYVSELVDAVLIADSQGKVLYQLDSRDETITSVTDIGSLFQKANGSNSKPALGLASCSGAEQIPAQNGSAVICTKLTGMDFQLFVQPQVLPLPVADIEGKNKLSRAAVFYVVGIKRQPGLLEDLRDLPIATVGAVLAFLVLLVIALPIAKLRLIGADERLHSLDAFLYFGSVLLITAALTLLVLDYTAYNALRQQMNGASNAIARQISDQFQFELQNSVDELRKIDFNEVKDSILPIKDYPPYQVVTDLDGDGELLGQQITYRDRIEVPGRVKDRHYFTAARYGELWNLGEDAFNNKCNQFFLDRIRVRSTGEKLTVIALPYEKECKGAGPPEPSNKRGANAPNGNSELSREAVRTSIKTFLTFRSHLLPPFYEFVVLDNATGRVMYDSEDSRSLLENFYAEFSKGDDLRSAAEYRLPIEMDGDYLGKSIALSIQPLAHVPWSVAVFYDRDSIQSIHFEIVAVSVAIFIGFTILFVMIPLVIRHQLASEPRWALLCRRQSRTKTYGWIALLLFGQAVFLLIATWFAQVPAVLVMFSGLLLAGPLLYLAFTAEPVRLWAGVSLIANAALLSIVFFVSWERSGFVLSTLSMLAILFFLLAGMVRSWRTMPPTFGRSSNVTRIAKIWNGAAYNAVAAAVLLLIAIVPTIGIFEEAFRNHMVSLTRYSQAYLAERYGDRYRLLQADVARMNPDTFAQPSAGVIDIDDDLKHAGIYASLTRLFPEPPGSEKPPLKWNLLNKEDIQTWDMLKPTSVIELNGAEGFGEARECARRDFSGYFQLTSLIAARLPDFDTISGTVHSFLPNLDNHSGDCWVVKRYGVQINFSASQISGDAVPTVRVLPIGRWPGLFSMTSLVAAFWAVLGVIVVWFLMKLASKRFLASEIAYPIQTISNRPNAEQEERVARWAKAVVESPEEIHLLVRMPDRHRDRFIHNLTLAIKNSSEPSKLEAPGRVVPENWLLKSCVGEKSFDGGAGDWQKLQSRSTILVLTDFHLALGSDEQLNRLLDLLDSRSKAKLPTVIFSEIYPLEAITHPDQYPDFEKQRQSPVDPVNAARWIQLLHSLIPHYWPTRNFGRSKDVLKRETQAFPDLEKLHERIDSFRKLRPNLTDDEIAELVRLHARSFYASLWRLCSKRERVLLFRLAQGDLVNPANNDDLTHLLERGILRRDPLIRLPNMSIKRFIVSAEPLERFNEWAGISKISAWSVVRIPLVALILLISITVAFMGKETSDYVLALLGTAATMPTLLFRLFGTLNMRPSGPATT